MKKRINMNKIRKIRDKIKYIEIKIKTKKMKV